MKELWIKVPGFSRYEVSNLGNIRSTNYKNSKKTKNVKPALSGGYYKTVLLNDDNEYKSIRVHRIVMLAFFGNSDLVVNHIDGNKENNNLNNLEYCTHSENIKHAFRIGLEEPNYGMKSGTAKLNDDQVLEIRKYAKKHGYLKNRKKLADFYGVCESTLKDIVSMRRGAWSHI